ncbi:MAG: hypothetical protein EHM20_15880, partial [Alphaproteobacteria bacterium]
MPRGDGAGSGGRGAGRGQGRGFQSGGTTNSSLRGQGAGTGGFCVCPGCGSKIEHQAGIPCTEVKCPKCG